jgi:hypothetical protein
MKRLPIIVLLSLVSVVSLSRLAMALYDYELWQIDQNTPQIRIEFPHIPAPPPGWHPPAIREVPDYDPGPDVCGWNCPQRQVWVI